MNVDEPVDSLLIDLPMNTSKTSAASSHVMPDIILPGATLGVMGGGQLGRMFVQAAQQMGYFTAVLDEADDSPAGCIAHHHIRTAYTDEKGLQQLIDCCAAITTEFENVPAAALKTLARHLSVYPKANAVFIAQDRLLEKELFTQSGVGCASYAAIQTPADIEQVDDALFPAILKTARLGYDGKGQVTVNAKAELQTAWQELHQVPCILEKKVPLASEISVLIARNQHGQTVNYPVQQNIHRNGILAITEVPVQSADNPLYQQAITAAKQLAQALDYVGVLCVEFFILQDGSLIANEIAPRPHNSAHWSMNGASYSQFEAQVRALTGLPLPQPVQTQNSIMLNLLGDLWFNAKNEQSTPPWDQILALPGTHLHLYGKTEAKKGRKMGHLNITATTFEQAKTTALQAAQILNITPW